MKQTQSDNCTIYFKNSVLSSKVICRTLHVVNNLSSVLKDLTKARG